MVGIIEEAWGSIWFFWFGGCGGCWFGGNGEGWGQRVNPEPVSFTLLSARVK